MARQAKNSNKDIFGRKKLLPTGSVILKNNKDLPIEDYFVRLRTTSVHNVKYADTIDILVNLLHIEEQALKVSSDTEAVVIKQISQYENYKTLLKGLQSKN